MATTPTYPSNNYGVIAKIIVAADTTAWVDLYDNSAASSKVRVESLNICSDDTATMNIQIGIHNGTSVFLLGTAQAITLSGTNGVAVRINALGIVGSLASDGIPIIGIPAGCKLQAKVLVTVTAAKTVTITGWVAKYD